jgi:hypothetical protein
MKPSHSFLLFVVLGCITFSRAQTTEELWQVVTDKLQATENNNFFLLIGNDSGIVYKFQKGIFFWYSKIRSDN